MVEHNAKQMLCITYTFQSENDIEKIVLTLVQLFPDNNPENLRFH